jgi:hypothetical protein
MPGEPGAATLPRLGLPLETSETAADECSTVDQAIQAEERCLINVDEKIASVKIALPEVLRSIQSFTRIQMNEVKSIKNRPPRAVRRALEALYVVLSCRPSESTGASWHTVGLSRILDAERLSRGLDSEKEWPRIQRMLSSSDFVQSVLSFDVSTLDRYPHVAEFAAARYFPSLRKECAEELSSVVYMDDIGSSASTEKLAPISLLGPKLRADSLSSKMPFGGATYASPAITGALPPASISSTPRGFRHSMGRMTAPVRLPLSARVNASPRLRVEEEARLRAEEEAAGLDVAAVEHASRACGVLVRWVLEVLREFFLLRELRSQRKAATERLDKAVNERKALEERKLKIKVCKLPTPPVTPPPRQVSKDNDTKKPRPSPRWIEEFSAECFAGVTPRSYE